MMTLEEFDELFLANHSAICAALWRAGAPIGDIKDLSHSVFIKARDKRGSFTGGSFSAWICTIAFRDAISDGRRRKRSVPLPLDGTGLAADNPSPLEVLELHEETARLRDCLQKLDSLIRRVVQAKIKGEPSVEIGQQVDRTAAQVNSIFHSAKNKLRECVENKSAKDGGRAQR